MAPTWSHHWTTREEQSRQQFDLSHAQRVERVSSLPRNWFSLSVSEQHRSLLETDGHLVDSEMIRRTGVWALVWTKRMAGIGEEDENSEQEWDDGVTRTVSSNDRMPSFTIKLHLRQEKSVRGFPWISRIILSLADEWFLFTRGKNQQQCVLCNRAQYFAIVQLIQACSDALFHFWPFRSIETFFARCWSFFQAHHVVKITVFQLGEAILRPPS